MDFLFSSISFYNKSKYYYVKVRAYYSYNGENVYGTWSKIKKIRIKR